jgi:hypothetical protein
LADLLCAHGLEVHGTFYNRPKDIEGFAYHAGGWTAGA